MSEKIKKLDGLGDPSYREISSNTPIYRLGHFCMNGVKTIWRM